MDEMKHTPGPWRAEHQPLGSAIYVDGGKSIAVAHGSAAITGEKLPHAANARLIAAAPDMLTALKAFVAKIDPAILDERDLAMSPLADELRDALLIIEDLEQTDGQ